MGPIRPFQTFPTGLPFVKINTRFLTTLEFSLKSFRRSVLEMKNTVVTKASNFNEVEDRALVAGCLEGDHAAWEALIRRYQRLIYSIPIKARLSQEDAADIFQSVCLKLYEKLNTIRDSERISSWLITTTSRECWRIAARKRRDSIPSGSDDENSNLIEIPATGLMADEEREVVERQLQVRQAVE